MSNIQKILITVGTLLFVMGLLRVNNNKKSHRGLQFPFLILSPLLVTAEIAALIILRVEIDQWLSQLSWLQPVYQAVTQSAGELFGIELLLLNAVIAVPYFFLKLLLRPIANAFMKRGEHMRAARAYAWDDEHQFWCLREDRTGLRGVLLGVLWIAFLLTCAVCAVGWIFGPESDFWFYSWPGAALIVIWEYYAYFCGLTKEEYLLSIGGEGVRSSTHCQFNKLRQIYEKLFPESLLFSRSGKDFQVRSGATQLLKDLSDSSDRIDRFVGEYYLHLKNKKPGEFDVDLITASNKLLHHQSTIIFNPFYQDISDYITLPIADTLLNGEKCLVIVGRQSTKEHIAQWLRDILAGYCRTDRLWQVSFLEDVTETCDVGILAFSDLYNLRVINNSGEFLSKVGFVLMVEPSRMLTTSQTGLSIVVGKFSRVEQPTFCALDHESDGLVDLLSHVFQQNVTSVVAAPAIQPAYTAMGWNASGDYKRQSLFQQQTHFLGNGTELAAVALKYQVPDVSWYSEEKAPVIDIRWIAEQYYSQIARFAGLPYEQKCIEDRILFSSDLWGSPVRDNSFIIAEDETCNLFATLRAYLSRGKKQSFVHVLSENYLLRDYMRSNWQLFMSDAKAIPMLSPHYAKTERNTVMRLVILMASEPVSQKYIEQELQLLGYDFTDCYKTLSILISRYTGIKDTIITVKNRVEYTETLPVTVQMYSILKRPFDLYFSDTLKNAFFVVEDEELGSRYIDARMFGHIKQLVMPGQQIIYGGKLYKVHSISPQAGCILHRASDEYMRRLYYRQIRTYTLLDKKSDGLSVLSAVPGPKLSKKEQDEKECVISCRKVGDMEITIENRSFRVSSTGYLEMRDQNDLRSARVIDLTKDPCISLFNRTYNRKAVMSLRLPGLDEKARYTLCLLLSELMHTLFPYSWQYLAVLCKKPQDDASALRFFTYGLEGAIDGELIYILEDSDMDLGLLEAIDNNLFRILEIVADYLNWHAEKMGEPPMKDPSKIRPAIPVPEPPPKTGLSGFISRIGDTLFGKNKKKKDEQPDGEGQNTEQSDAPAPESEAPALPKSAPAKTPEERPKTTDRTIHEEKRARKKNRPDVEVVDETAGDSPNAEGEQAASPYAQSCFLKFGYDEISASLALTEVRDYLNGNGFGHNSLLTARKGGDAEAVNLDMRAECSCDFCGKPLNGVNYDRLADGRIRCQNCSSSAINDVAEFTEVFNATLVLMEENFRISYHAPIGIRITDARTLGHLSGRVFVPTSGYDGRVVGFAQRKGKDYTLYVENGSPRLATIATIAHEMTHVWQYINWKKNQSKINSLYKTKKERDIVYEGMASWAEIQILYMIGEYMYAQEQEQILRYRAQDKNDVYGVGFVLFSEKYDIGRQGDAPAKTPFNTFPPL